MRKHGGGKTAPDYPQGQGRKVMVYLEPLTIQLVKKMAEKGGMSQSEAVRSCIRNEQKALGIKAEREYHEERTAELFSE